MWYTSPYYTSINNVHGRLTMRRVMTRFWSPFCRRITGPDLRAYGFHEVFNSIRTHDDDFTCQVNGQVGDAKLVEDFFILLLCGFNIMDVKLENSSMTDAINDSCNFKGTYTLEHARPFLGWSPTSVNTSSNLKISSPLLSFPTPNCSTPITNTTTNTTAATAFTSGDSNSMNSSSCDGDSDITAVKRRLDAPPPPLLLRVPFTARLEGSERGISHMILRSPALNLVAAHHSCPPAVRSCLQNSDAMQALVRLRRANVRPDIITDKTLMSIGARKEAWSSAMGIL
ncbi:uncharacterized protein TM35_000042490 [Trypanosoma theileri]|uniref:Uncharacterized protein n=1 Tax=Trypanosoma theileri TaxID=67003 RepID=A0A1X0P581_9TRYP|nr:uncharacterized protein TM35_000042490 [Trypanosoma theileri]ORC92035.1 hypothetical protein TM35_000042490 [Trypanosoma theileri]